MSRIKILAEMNIVERRRSQDGQIEIAVDGRELDIRVATMATIWGEKVVLRVLDRSVRCSPSTSSGCRPDAGRLLAADPVAVRHDDLAGPTGSGKTTTLYAALNQIADSNGTSPPSKTRWSTCFRGSTRSRSTSRPTSRSPAA